MWTLLEGVTSEEPNSLPATVKTYLKNGSNLQDIVPMKCQNKYLQLDVCSPQLLCLLLKLMVRTSKFSVII